MPNIGLDTASHVNRALRDDELDSVRGGTSHFIASCMAATALNLMDPTANCFVGDNNKVVCAK